MSVTFTKLFSSITESTVWCEPDSTRIAWITMLAMADSRGRVWASIPGLANRARISVSDARKAIATFLAPDLDSRTSDNEGRRLEAIDGGWRLLNHEKYRSIRDEESIKESKRRYINARREAERKSAQGVENVDRGRDNAEAEAEAEKEKTKQAPAKPARFDSVAALSDLGVDSSVAGDWLKLRKQKRAPVTQTALDGIRREAEKAGISMNDALKTCCSRGWQGFEAAWLSANGVRAGPGRQTQAQEREAVSVGLTGRGKANGERDITGEAVRVA